MYNVLIDPAKPHTKYIYIIYLCDNGSRGVFIKEEELEE